MDEETHKAELVLDNINLRARIGILETEIGELKQAVADMCFDELLVLKHQRRKMKATNLAKWSFYHHHKAAVVEHLNIPKHMVSWSFVKQHTDKLYNEGLS